MIGSHGFSQLLHFLRSLCRGKFFPPIRKATMFTVQETSQIQAAHPVPGCTPCARLHRAHPMPSVNSRYNYLGLIFTFKSADDLNRWR